jgi:hypothetical protein
MVASPPSCPQNRHTETSSGMSMTVVFFIAKSYLSLYREAQPAGAW